MIAGANYRRMGLTYKHDVLRTALTFFERNSGSVLRGSVSDWEASSTGAYSTNAAMRCLLRSCPFSFFPFFLETLLLLLSIKYQTDNKWNEMKGHGWEVGPTLPKREGSPNTTLTCAAQASSFVVFSFPSPPPSPLLGWDVLSPGPTPRKHSLSRSLSPTTCHASFVSQEPSLIVSLSLSPLPLSVR